MQLSCGNASARLNSNRVWPSPVSAFSVHRAANIQTGNIRIFIPPHKHTPRTTQDLLIHIHQRAQEAHAHAHSRRTGLFLLPFNSRPRELRVSHVRQTESAKRTRRSPLRFACASRARRDEKIKFTGERSEIGKIAVLPAGCWLRCMHMSIEHAWFGCFFLCECCMAYTVNYIAHASYSSRAVRARRAQTLPTMVVVLCWRVVCCALHSFIIVLPTESWAGAVVVRVFLYMCTALLLVCDAAALRSVQILKCTLLYVFGGLEIFKKQ